MRNRTQDDQLDGRAAYSGTDQGWAIHDRTHLEISLRLPLPRSASAPRAFCWESYFLLPSGLRVSQANNSKASLYRSLQSYFGLKAPSVSLPGLLRHAQHLPTALQRGDGCEELKLFGCIARRSLVTARKHLLRRCARADAEQAASAVRRVVDEVGQITDEFRRLSTPAQEVEQCWQLVDGYLSRLAEDFFARVSLALESASQAEAAAIAARAAAREAQYAVQRGFAALVPGTSERDVEALESATHVLKRFTSSALWLPFRVEPAGRWVLQVGYALAAAIAMAFAIGLARYHGTTPRAESLGMWMAIVAVAYAGKDRVKATLQNLLQRWLEKRLPDRTWSLLAPAGGDCLATAAESVAHIDPAQIPRAAQSALAAQTPSGALADTGLHRALWHRKAIRLDRAACKRIDARFQEAVELVRLDVSRWLRHTDDSPKRIYFAGVHDEEVREASAPRAYTIAVAYRFCPNRCSDAPWQCARIVVDRNGIRRVVAGGEAPSGQAAQALLSAILHTADRSS